VENRYNCYTPGPTLWRKCYPLCPLIEISYENIKMNINQKIADELKVNDWQVQATVKLLNEGATVPFIARYRKEITGSLTDTDLRYLEERLAYLVELEERKHTILTTIEQQGKLTEVLKASIMAADNKARLEDLYLPYKPKRRTKAEIAKEAGLEPLANLLLNRPQLSPEQNAIKYLNPKQHIETIEQALEGARHILTEQFAEQADLLAQLRRTMWEHSVLVAELIKEKEAMGAKFSDYFDYREPLKKVPSHRALAVFRGQKENILRVHIALGDSETQSAIQQIAHWFNIHPAGHPGDAWLAETLNWAWKVKFKLKLEIDMMLQLKEAAETVAIKVFKDNLKHLLMAAPAGDHVVMGLDPGLRSGVKAVIVDGTGKLLTYTTIFPHVPKRAWAAALATLTQLCQQYAVRLVSIGNGTASRETDQLITELMATQGQLNLTKVTVSEAGASVYSASQVAANEFPHLDVTYRGAVSIARRLQDPLAELVKIDPKAIGVGQYQHDVNQIQLERSLHGLLEDCVNAIGADVNTASVPLLKSIAGLNETVAQNIVSYREANGPFKNRKELKKVPRLGEKTFQQAIGFLRIIGGDNPLDASAVHPEAYPLIEKIIQQTHQSIQGLMGNLQAIQQLKVEALVSAEYGLPTVVDVLEELKKPGRDPRPKFSMPKFKSGINTIEDLRPNLQLEGVVTNVTNFGAFIDIGVHQDGLVHISQMADQYISDPHKVLKVGQIVKVKVLEIDIARNRIQLSMKNSAPAPAASTAPATKGKAKPKPTSKNLTMGSHFGDTLANALKSK